MSDAADASAVKAEDDKYDLRVLLLFVLVVLLVVNSLKIKEPAT